MIPIRNLSDENFRPQFERPRGSGLSSATSLPKDRELALKALEVFASLEEDWNGYGAAKPSKLSLEKANNLISKMPLPFKAPNHVHSDEDGDMVLTWSESDSRLIVTIEPLMVHLSYEKTGQPTVYHDDIIFDGETIPEKIKEYLPKRVVNGNVATTRN